MKSLRPIGIFGGTFDPIHLAHLRLAEEVGDEYGLSEVRLIPNLVPPHRHQPDASIDQRISMLKLAIKDNSRLKLDDRETKREGPSFTVDTLKAIRKELPEQSLALIMGSDAFSQLTTWYQWQAIFLLSHIIIASRASNQNDSSTQEIKSTELQLELKNRMSRDKNQLVNLTAGKIFIYKFTGLAISSTMLRQQLNQNKSMRYLVPRAVHDYIKMENLYKR